MENNILKGDEIYNPINYTSLGKFVLDTLENNPDFLGQVDALTREEYTYREMRDRSVRCALWMRSQGLHAGDLISICSHNQMDIAMPCFGALYLGVAFNPLDAAMNAREILHLMTITKPKMAFVNEKSATVVAEAVVKAQLDTKIIVLGQAAGFFEFDKVIAEPEVDEVKNFECALIGSPDETAVVVCSSGTTGLPKGVALSHGALLRQLFQSEIFNISGNNCLNFSSLYWITGTLCIFLTLFSMVPRIVAPPFEEYTACELVENFQITWILLGSSMINRLLKSSALGRYNLGCIKRVYCGGSPLSIASQEAFAKFLPNATITVAYGLTEFAGIAAMQTANSKPGSCGRILANAQLKVIDPNTGRKLGANQRGELLLKSFNMMNCYVGNSQATAETLDEEGWLHSGDLGYYDEDGEIFVIDRMKELIKYRGYQVSPFDIESLILSHPGVKEVAVVGLPHPVDDEHPIAFVVKSPNPSDSGEEVTEMMLMDFVAAQLSDSKRLRGGVKFIDSLPKSPTDKIRRKELRDLAANSKVNGQSSRFT